MGISEIAQRIGPAVVGLGRGARGGSGVVVASGQVATLLRNLRHDEVEIVFADGRRAAGKLSASDADLDVAVIAVDTADVEPVSWAGADADTAIGIGTPVYALGNPAGRGLRATAGALASAPRRVRGPRGRMLEGALEHTAPLPRGSGGGPLLDADGRVLGLNAIRLDGSLILALPATVLAPRVTELAAGRGRPRRRLGVAIVPSRAARRLRVAVGLPERDGVLVRAVQAQTPADAAGVQRGDLIVALAGRDVASIDDLYVAVDAVESEAPVPLRVVRGAEERELSVSFNGVAADAADDR